MLVLLWDPPSPIPCFFHYNLETAYCTRTIIAWNSSLIFIFFAAFISQPKVIMQGKLFQRCTHLLYCSVLSLGGNLNTRRMSQPDMGSIFQMKNHWNILVIGNYYVNYQNFQINARILNEHLCIYSCLQIPPRDVRRVYATAINFPCIIILVETVILGVCIMQPIQWYPATGQCIFYIICFTFLIVMKLCMLSVWYYLKQVRKD